MSGACSACRDGFNLFTKAGRDTFWRKIRFPLRQAVIDTWAETTCKIFGHKPWHQFDDHGCNERDYWFCLRCHHFLGLPTANNYTPPAEVEKAYDYPGREDAV